MAIPAYTLVFRLRSDSGSKTVMTTAHESVPLVPRIGESVTIHEDGATTICRVRDVIHVLGSSAYVVEIHLERV